MFRSFASLFAAIVLLGCTALPAFSSVRSEHGSAPPRRAQAPAPATPGGPGGAPNQGGGGNAVVIESGRSYVVEIVIIVAVCGAALWAVCKSANRV